MYILRFYVHQARVAWAVTRKYQTVNQCHRGGLVFAFMSNIKFNEQDIDRAAKQMADLFVAIIDSRAARQKKTRSKLIVNKSNSKNDRKL